MSAATTQHARAAKSPTPTKTSFPQTLGGIALIAILILVVYWPALHGGFILDDEDSLQRCGQATWQQIWFSATLPDYWPLTESMLHIEWNMWGTSTVGYHLINLLLHLGATLMLWRILRMLAVPGAFVAALLFAVHPVNVESVAWIVQRKNTLAMFWFLISAWFYLRTDDNRFARTRKRDYWLSLAAFILAMLSKIAVVILPALLVLITWWRRPLTKRDVMRVIPFFALAAIFSVINVWFMAHSNTEGIRSVTWLQRVLGAGAVTWFYLWKALLPLNLAFIYPKWQINVSNWIWFVPTAAALAMTTILTVLRKNARARALLVGWLFFCIALLPVMGLSDTGFMKFSLVADHYQHIAIIAVVTLVAVLLSKVRQSQMHIAIIAILTGALVVKATQQATIYRDAITLYRAAVEKNPSSWILHGNLADELLAAGQVDASLVEFRETLKLNPQSDDAHYFYGAALLRSGAVDDAFAQFTEVVNQPAERYHLKAYHGLAEIYLGRGDKPQALAMEEKAQGVARKYGFEQIVAQSEQWLKQVGLK